MNRMLGIALAAGLAASGAAGAVCADDDEAAGGQADKKANVTRESRQRRVVNLQIAGQPNVVYVGGQDAGDAGRHWIGVNCSPVDDALRAHVALPAGAGLLVDLVVDDSPAAKAGLERYDVLITANDRPLKTVRDLVESVEAAGKDEKPFTLKIRRGGKERLIAVQPTERTQQPERDIRLWFLPERDRVFNFLEQPGEGQRDLDFQAVRPMVVEGSRGVRHLRLPSGMKISIQKEGDKPAVISVEKDGKTHETTADDLDKLPEDVRPHVRRMLGQGTASLGDFDGAIDIQLTLPRVQPVELDPPVPHVDLIRKVWRGPAEWAERQQAANVDLQKRLEQLNQRLDELQQAIEKLQERGKSSDE